MIYAPRKSLLLSENSAESQYPSDKRGGSSHWGLGDVDLYRCSVSFCSICGANRPESASVCMSAIVMSRTKKGKSSQSCYVKKEKRMPAIAISNAGMLSQMRGLELNFGDFELNFGDLNKKREIFRGDRRMPRRAITLGPAQCLLSPESCDEYLTSAEYLTIH